MRVTPDHWNTFLDFAEQNPELITNRFNGIHGNVQRNLLWTKAAYALNSLGHGQKTVAQWRKAVTDWKAKTKAKLSKPYNEIALTRTERRLLSLMGKQALRKRRKVVIIPGEDRKRTTEMNRQSEDEQAGLNFVELVGRANVITEPESTVELQPSTSHDAKNETKSEVVDVETSDSSVELKYASSLIGYHKERRHRSYRNNPLGKPQRQSEALAVMNNIGHHVEKISNSIDKLVTIYEKLTEFCERMLAR